MIKQDLWQQAKPASQLKGRDIAVRFIDVGTQYLISGKFEQPLAALGVNVQGAGAFAMTKGKAYSVRIARDRVLVVSDDPSCLTAGWHEEGFAVSSVSGALAVIELSGSGAARIINSATSLDILTNSPSAALNFAGLNGFLYRHEESTIYRLHFDRGLASFLWEWLAQAIKLAELDDVPASAQ